MFSFSNKKPFSLLLCLSFCAVFFFSTKEASAQLIPGTGTSQEEAAEPQWPLDSLGRRTPRGTVSGFIKAVADKNYSRASSYLNVKEVPTDERTELARTMQVLLDQKGKILPYSWISDEPGGKVEDNLPPERERVGSITAEGETFNLLVEQVNSAGEAPVWLFSSETVEKVAALATDGGDISLIDKILPEVLEDYAVGGVPVGQWLILLVLVFLSYLVSWLIISIILFITGKVWHRATTEPTAGIIHALALPVKLFLAVPIFVNTSQALGISIIIRQRFSEFTVITGVLAFLILFWRLSEFIGNYTEKRMTLRGQFSAVSIIIFLKRFAKIVIIVVGFIAILGAFGVNVTAGFAALGIGGIALALGAQKSMENFVGGVTLIADRPLRVGDFCKVGETIGTVEQIGMRSTRIRTLDRTLVSVPNGELSSTRIENYAHRDQFRFYTVFNFRYETSRDQLRFLLVELRKILYAHPKVFPEPARVRFVEFGAASLNVEIFAYLNAVDFSDFLEIKEDILLRMMQVVENSGTEFAFPSQTIYFGRDKGLSENKVRVAEEKVREWKEEGKLSIPKFDPEDIEKLKDSISYPPEESSYRPQDNKTTT